MGFEYDGTHLRIGGIDPGNTRRAANIRDGNTKVAVVIDDLASTRPWKFTPPRKTIHRVGATHD